VAHRTDIPSDAAPTAPPRDERRRCVRRCRSSPVGGPRAPGHGDVTPAGRGKRRPATASAIAVTWPWP